MDLRKHFDVVVIGAGPGGYVAAIRAAQNGASVALVEKSYLGGTCLNVGCIPSKALLARAGLLEAIKQAEKLGIHVGDVRVDYATWIEQKDEIVTGLVRGIAGLMQANGIAVFNGHGRFASPHEIKVVGEDNARLVAEKSIIATGSECKNIKAFPFDGERIHSSTTLLSVKEPPKRLAVIGGGYIGCEMASLFHALDVEIVLIEMLPMILPTEGQEIAQTMTEIFTRGGIQIHTGAAVQSIERSDQGVRVHIEGVDPIESDMALVAIGRDLNTADIGLERAGLAAARGGVIPVNDQMETAVPGIYAIGDITGKVMLAHMASHQGIVAADNATGRPSKIHYNAVPSVVFTHPEIGSVGLTLEKAKAAGYDAVIGKFPFAALGKSQAVGATAGFARIVADRKSGQILGAQVIGEDASTLIGQMGLAITNELTIESIEETIHAHPTISEAWLEATLDVTGKTLHLPPKRKRA